MGKFAYLAVEPNADLIDSDLREVAGAAKKLFNHAFILAGSISFGTTFLKSIASFAAMGWYRLAGVACIIDPSSGRCPRLISP